MREMKNRRFGDVQLRYGGWWGGSQSKGKRRALTQEFFWVAALHGTKDAGNLLAGGGCNPGRFTWPVDRGTRKRG